MNDRAASTTGSRFSDVLRSLKRWKKIKNEGQIASENGFSASLISEIKANRMQPSEVILKYLEENFDVNPEFILNEQGDIYKTAQPNYQEQLRNQKLEDDPFMVPYIDIPAQAGYSKAYQQRDYVATLRKYPILPDVDPTGAVWRYFAIAGESMEPEFLSGDVILCSQVHKEDWQTVTDKHTHVIVTEEDLLIKDVYKYSPDLWILLSQNETYPPIQVKVEDIKQVWVMRRHVKARAKKHRWYDIDAIKKDLNLK